MHPHHCPECRIDLEEKKADHGVHWECPSCGGTGWGVALLRRVASDRHVQKIWMAAAASNEDGRQCPACDETMRQVRGRSKDPVKPDLMVDVCLVCWMIWLDRGELAEIGPHEDPPSKVSPIHPLSRLTDPETDWAD
jgi:Zn-finger nucleic acid-binding protein